MAEVPKTEPKQVITPWVIEAESSSGVDYDRLCRDFGLSKIEPHHIERISKLTGTKPHRFLRRGIFYAHRDLDGLLNDLEKEKPFYVYTGRGPSSDSLHFGHLIPMIFTQWLQEAFNVPLVIQMTDDEKFLFKEGLSLKDIERMTRENSKDLIACGFDPKKTFIFSDINYIKELYPNVLEVQKRVTYNQSKNVFGFSDSDNIGKSAFPAVQAAPAFYTSFPEVLGPTERRVLIPQGIDQDPYFRITRDVAERMGQRKPACIHSKFFPALQGFQTKMSGSTDISAIFLTDSEKTIKTKINKYAFSGGRDTAEEHRKYGANLKIDVPFNWLRFFLESDEELAEIEKNYGSGKMLTGEVKARLISLLQELVRNHVEKRAAVTEADVDEFMRVRKISVD